MDESLWPARNIAEYAYCPRLFYLMEVEGIFWPSADTEKGLAVHRRVDRPSGESFDDDDEGEVDSVKPKLVRKLTLTSKPLGLTATLDITEISGKVAVPVEYRKGRAKRTTLTPPPDDPGEAEEPLLARPEAWPTDRVQVGLHAILLKESGYEVSKAVLYYAAEKLRMDIVVDECLESEALSVLEAAKRCAGGQRPMPLVNDARCIRCSLQPICLPDEVNQQRGVEPSEELTPRKIWPPRDDGIHFVAQLQGVKIGVKGMAMTVTDKNGQVLKEVPLANVESLSLLGSVQISTQAVHALADRGIPIAYLSAAGRLVAMVDPMDSVSAEIRRAQVKKLEENEYRIQLSRSLVFAKIMNQRTLLMRNHSVLSENVATDLAKEAERAREAVFVDSVRGHEGQAAAIYFQHFAGMFKGPLAADFDANGRQRRPPPDPINACLSLAYSMLTHECVAALRLARLEPSIGAYHVSRPGRPALALDLMEPFRPIVADSSPLPLSIEGS
jgi:CRISPR-associated endonuclease Cas1/CRISPR-associated protein Cas4